LGLLEEHAGRPRAASRRLVEVHRGEPRLLRLRLAWFPLRASEQIEASLRQLGKRVAWISSIEWYCEVRLGKLIHLSHLFHLLGLASSLRGF